MAIQDRHAFNVAVSELMILSNTLRDTRHHRGSPVYQSALETLCLLLAPMAPHITSQLWQGPYTFSAIIVFWPIIFEVGEGSYCVPPQIFSQLEVFSAYLT